MRDVREEIGIGGHNNMVLPSGRLYGGLRNTYNNKKSKESRQHRGIFSVFIPEKKNNNNHSVIHTTTARSHLEVYIKTQYVYIKNKKKKTTGTGGNIINFQTNYTYVYKHIILYNIGATDKKPFHGTGLHLFFNAFLYTRAPACVR